MTFVVEISNPKRSNGKPYERWKLEGVERLAKQLEDELGWTPTASADAAELVEKGQRFENDSRSGKKVVAFKITEAVAA